MHSLGKLVQDWKAPSISHRDASFSLHGPILATLGEQRSLEGNKARSFPCISDSGGAPASEDSSQATSSWHFFDALEEPLLEEELSQQTQQLRNHKHEIESLKIEVRQLGLLIDSFAKTDHDFLELRKRKGEQTESFSSLHVPGGAPAFIGSCFQAASRLENAEPVRHEASQKSPHNTQFLAAVVRLHEAIEHFEALIQSDSFNQNAYTLGLEFLRTKVVDNKLDQESVREEACKNKLGKGKGEHSRVDIPEQQQNKLRTLGQNKQLLEGQLRHDLDNQQKTNSFEQLRLGQHKNKEKNLQKEEAKKQKQKKHAQPGVQLTLLSFKRSNSFSQSGATKQEALAGLKPSSPCSITKQELARQELAKEQERSSNSLQQLQTMSCT